MKNINKLFKKIYLSLLCALLLPFYCLNVVSADANRTIDAYVYLQTEESEFLCELVNDELVNLEWTSANQEVAIVEDKCIIATGVGVTELVSSDNLHAIEVTVEESQGGIMFASLLGGENSQNSTTHYLAFASDRHSNTNAIGEAMSTFNSNTEYVALIGDMVNQTDAYDVSTVKNEVTAKFADAEVDIMWGTHDKNYTDIYNLGIMNCVDANSSGIIYRGPDSDNDRTPDYYVYGVAFKDMQSKEYASTQSALFERWVDTIDCSIPIIVVCHMPLHAKRDDNLGGYTWGKALNYAATGSEEDDSLSVTRDVIFFYGHNHTVEKEEYYYPVNSIVQLENGDGKNSGMGDSPGGDHQGGEPPGGEHGSPPAKPAASLEEDDAMIVDQPEDGVEPSLTLKFTYLAAGYLNADTHATQLTMTEDDISFNRSGTVLGTINRVKDVYEINYGSQDASIELNANETITLSPTTTLSNATISWSSDNTSVITVDNGTLTTVGNGTANVLATIKYKRDGSLESKSITYEVTVSGYETEPIQCQYIAPKTCVR